MKKITFAIVLFVCVILHSCNYAPQPSQPIVKDIDTTAIVEKINSFEIQPIDKLEVFQVFEGTAYSEEYGSNYKSCLAKSYKYNKNHYGKYDEYEEVNSSSLYITFDDKILLYNELEITGDDFLMIDTYTYDTKGGKALGIEIPSKRLTVPVYVKKSELLKLYGVEK